MNFRMLLPALLACLSLLGCATDLRPAAGKAVLVFSHTTGYRHASIEAGVAAIRAIGARDGYAVQASEDPAIFTAERLRPFNAIVLLSTTTDPKRPDSEWLVGERRQALQDYVHGGGAIVAVHAAADSHYFWPWYGRMIGGHFQRHPAGTPRGRLRVFDAHHPSTRGLPELMSRVDEWYYFDDYDPTARLLVTLDPQSIGEADVNPNPISWARTFEGGRIFYTAMGHTEESYRDPLFLSHLAGGLRWALSGRDERAPRRQNSAD